MVEKLRVDVPTREVAELGRRIRDTRWPDSVADDWQRGTRPSALRRLLDHWSAYDWFALQQRINGQDHVLVPTADGRVHVWRAGRRGAPALLLIHGWPDSFLRYDRVVPLLAADFDLVVPSVPGYGFSDRPMHGGTASAWTAAVLSEVMEKLGIERYGVHGGDIGTGIAEQLTLAHPERITGLHLGDMPLWRALGADDLTGAERSWVEGAAAWSESEGAYSTLQRTKPQTLAAGLTDSPAGLASWQLEKFQAWGEGDVFERIPIDLIAANLSVYWYTRTAASAARYYYESRITPPTGGRVEVRTAFGLWPHDIQVAPRSFAERMYPLERFTEFPRGGHFGAMEEPELLAADLRAFFG
ncbi:MAG: epoxide hydrolase [Micrococcales bacterium]|nr:epoxide hydrolase [Micrococcales bacterium]